LLTEGLRASTGDDITLQHVMRYESISNMSE
jgi:hypothetical protein